MNSPIAEFRTYVEMRKALMAVREHHDISFELLDEIAGMQSGYSAKLLGPRSIRRMGMQSLDLLLGALGVKGVLVIDPEALARVKGRFEKRDVPHLQSVMHTAALHITLSGRHMAIISRKGGRASWSKLTPKQRTRKARKMAKSRWRKMKMRARQRKETHARRKAKK